MQLTEDQKEYILNNYESTPDLKLLTRGAFKNDELEGRHKEGRAVRKFLVENHIDFNTASTVTKVKEILLTDDQKELIKNCARDGMSPFEISKLIWEDIKLSPLHKEVLTVKEFIKLSLPEYLNEKEETVDGKYVPPVNMSEVIGKINRHTDKLFALGKMNMHEKKCAEILKIFMTSPRFVQTINQYSKKDDRVLFEAEFVRTTWDKPDLTVDEVNLYINVCIDFINLKNISKHMEKLNILFEESEDQDEFTIRLAELLKVKSKEYDECEKRMESLIKKLNGDRSKRMEARVQENASILSLVEAFRDEKEREIMIQQARMKRLAIEQEADRLESVSEMKARIMGVGKSHVS